MYILLKPLFSRHKGIGVQFTDEPTGNLDYKSSEEIIELLHHLCNQYKKTIIMVTHNQELCRYTSRIIRIKDGEIEI